MSSDMDASDHKRKAARAARPFGSNGSYASLVLTFRRASDLAVAAAARAVVLILVQTRFALHVHRALASLRGTVAALATRAARRLLIETRSVVLVSVVHGSSFFFVEILGAPDVLPELEVRTADFTTLLLRGTAVDVPRLGRGGSLAHAISLAIFHCSSFLLRSSDRAV